MKPVDATGDGVAIGVRDTSFTTRLKMPPVKVKLRGVLSKSMNSPPLSVETTLPVSVLVNSALVGVVPGGAVKLTRSVNELPV